MNLSSRNRNQIPQGQVLQLSEIPSFIANAIKALGLSDIDGIDGLITITNNHDGFLQLNILGVKAAFVTNPDLYKAILAADIDKNEDGVFNKGEVEKMSKKFPDGRYIEDLIHLLAASGLGWERVRKIVLGSFTPKSIDEMSNGIQEKVDKVLKFSMQHSESGEAFNIREDVTVPFAMSAIMEEIFGINFEEYAKSKKKSEKELALEISEALITISSWRLKSGIPIIGRASENDTDAQIFENGLIADILEKVGDNSPPFIKNVKEALNKYKKRLENDPSQDIARQEGELSAEEAQALISIMIFAGHDTTANSLAFAILDLTKSGKLVVLLTEIQKYIGEDGNLNVNSIFDLLKNGTIKAIFNEQLNNRVQAPIQFRSAIKPFVIDGQEIMPEGTNVLLLQGGVSENIRNEIKILEAKLEEGNTAEDNIIRLAKLKRMYDNFAFSDGVRRCLGIYLAQAEILWFLVGLSKSGLRFEQQDLTTEVKEKYIGGAVTTEGSAVMVTAHVNPLEG